MPSVYARILAGQDCISGFEVAAERRYQEAKVLLRREHRYAAIYLLGYAIEMWLKAAYYRNEGMRTHSAPILHDDMHDAWKNRNAAGIATTAKKNLHDLAGWARLLTYIRSAAGLRPPYVPAMKLVIKKMADAVRQHWDPAMRYRHMRLLSGELKTVLDAATWFRNNYNGL